MGLFINVAWLQLKGMFRAARYGVQFLLLPALMISIFLSAYLAVRALGGQIQGLFFPFITFLLSASAINIPMQTGNQLLSDSNSAHLLVTPRGLRGLLVYFLGIQAIYLSTNIISIIIAYLLVHPPIVFLNTILGLLLLSGWCISLVTIGLAMGMRFLFAFHLAQLIFLGFYPFLLMLPLVGKVEYCFILPPVGIITIFQNQGNITQIFLFTITGILLYNWAGLLFLNWAYHEYRIGKGVNRV